MKRKITDLEQKLINDGWCLTNKRYTGKHSEKIHCYEYHKTSDLRNDGKTYDQIIMLDQKRMQVVDFGINNVHIDFLNDQELCLLRFLHLELKHYVERITGKENIAKIVIKDICDEDKQKLLNHLNNPNKIMCLPDLNEHYSEYDERQELPPMTPEQFDELCEEMENAKGS